MKISIKRILLTLFVIFVLLPAAFLYSRDFIFPFYYDVTQRGIIDRVTLKDKIQIGEVIKFKQLAPTAEGVVCVLYPYGSSILIASEPTKSKINSYLKERKVSLSEGEWAFITVMGNAVSMTIYGRFADLDILSSNVALSYLPGGLSANFEPVACANIEEAALYKLKHDDRVYITLGRVK